MKLTNLMILISLMHVSAASLGQHITLKKKQVTLRYVFHEIHKQSGYNFIWSTKKINSNQKVDLNMDNLPLVNALDVLLRDLSLDYTIAEKTIIIKEKTLVAKVLPIAGRATIAEQQQLQVNGKVQSDAGENLAGVTVSVKGTDQQVLTDVNGQFHMQLNARNPILIFSFIGYQVQEAAVGAQQFLNIRLEKEVFTLDDVVVQAYGTIKKSALTNSVASIAAKDMDKRQISNISAALVGAAPGLQTNTGSGQPGEGPSIRIRGFGTINGNADPLIVLDGAPFSGPLSYINPDDIDNISVLKDASASALYGARGANGVIIINSKKGKAGSAGKINLKVTQGVNARGLQDYERLNAYEYYPMLWESLRNNLNFAGMPIDEANQQASQRIKSLLVYNPFSVPDDQIVLPNGRINPDAKLSYPEDLDWRTELRRNGIRGEYNVNFTGGAEKIDYFISMGHVRDEGYSVLTDFKRTTGRANINAQVKKWLKIGANLNTAFQNSKVGNENSGTWENPFYTDLVFAPIYPVYLRNADGSYQMDGNNRAFDEGPFRPIAPGRNVLAETTYNDNFNERNMLGARTYLTLTPLPHFNFTTNLGLDHTNYRYMVFDSPKIGDGVASGGRSFRTLSSDQTLNFNQLLTYDRTLDKHAFDVLLGHETYQHRYNYSYGQAAGQIMEGSTELVNFSNILTLRSHEDNYRIASYFGRGQYNYDQKYFFSTSYRIDGSSRFAKDVRYGTFWSVGGGWQIDKEDFFKSNLVNHLKLRASYGQVGSDDLGSYYLYQTFYDTGYKNGTEAGIKQALTLGNSDLKWESNNNMDIALEFGLFKNRISGSVEYFNRFTDNLLFKVPLSLSSGLLYKYQNFGSLINRGLEVSLTFEPIRKQDLNWTLGVNMTSVTNKIEKLPFDEFIDGTKKYMVGKSRYDFWLKQWYGVDPATGRELYRTDNPDAAGAKMMEDGVLVTTNGGDASYAYAGTAIPKLYGSIDNNIRFKDFSFGFRFIYQLGGKSYDNDYQTIMQNGTYGRALHKDALLRWQQPGDITNVPVRNTGDILYDSDRWLVDASYLYLKSMNMAYTLPNNLLEKAKIAQATVFLTGENLLFFTKRKGFDPSQAFNGNSSYTYAPTRIISLGVNLTF